jgi:hypothetical protein
MKHCTLQRVALAPVLALLTIAGGACNGAVGQQAAAGTTGGGADDVTGTMIDRYFTETGSVDRPVDLSTMTIKAHVRQGGSWVTRAGTGETDGSFTVPDVPQGLYLLEVSGVPADMSGTTTSYVYTAARTIDLGTEVGGRPDAVLVEPPLPTIHATLQNLSPWQGGDLVTLWSPNVAGSGGPLLSPTAGTTTFSGDFQWLGALVDASKGDVVYAIQYTQHAGAIPYKVLSGLASFPGVEQALKGTSIDGALAAPVVESIAMDYRGSEFTAQGAATNPGAQFAKTDCYIGTGPGMSTAGMLISSPSLLHVITWEGLMDANLGKTDVVAAMTYGSPFPTAWGIGVSVEADWNVPEAWGTAVGVRMTPAEASSGPIRPLITPVQSPAVNGRNAFGSLSDIGISPTLSWVPPAKGTASAYVVSVVESTSGASVLLPLSIVTTQTSLPLPPGLLESGHSYNFLIRSVASPIDASTAPFRQSLSYAYADVVTSAATP